MLVIISVDLRILMSKFSDAVCGKIKYNRKLEIKASSLFIMTIIICVMVFAVCVLLDFFII